jgi:hypothetical protein
MADLASQPTDLADEPTDTVAAEATPQAVAESDAPTGSAPAGDDLLGELARAMHAAATSQYERMNADLERRRTEQVEAIAARAAGEIEHLKATTEQDIGAIDAWAKAETEKIKQERLRRIDARRERLAAQLERQDTIRQREIFAIEVAIDAHRGEIDQFFGRMERESDPTAIARVASSLPPFPALADIADEARRGATAEFEDMEREIEVATPPEVSKDDDMPEAIVSESRLMAVMDPDAANAVSAGEAPPWEAPHAVSVAAGSGASEAAGEPEPQGRMGSTLLRTVRAIRPMAASDKDDSAR